MPPPLPLGCQRLALRPASTLLASMPLRATTRCPATDASGASASASRHFSTTPTQRRVRIPPESPKFITVPEVSDQAHRRSRRGPSPRARRDALQELYIAAKNFIVSEEELERHVEVMFRPTYFSDAQKTIQTTKNLWDLDGSPITVKELMNQFARASKDSTSGSSESREAARQKAVAEQLTGGKLPTS
ncbi:hypothetical protein MAPG_06817 [Magnaporthiopsis poae ATCC 64411]|uniref:Uncharacterized protein n=1 Tax=Magnaporthiopsis poae (strain ATCC 64411 / 73-15) TaxID=644358 RepID=A0A0C4E325_MAGP6|nr:hypothetical protein MAPG_06817 [Magnaporthiopsis poae ATCC 64411]